LSSGFAIFFLVLAKLTIKQLENEKNLPLV
jgi:hypothetical protein